jgi:hypothetical protein
MLIQDVRYGLRVSTVQDVRGAHARIFQEALRAVAELPGRVALAALVPMDGSNIQTTIRLAETASPLSTSPDVSIVSTGYFSLLDIPFTQGREFNAEDRAASPPVAVVNESMARGFWNGNAVGRTFTQ